MQPEPLLVETLSGKAEGTRIIRLSGPLTLLNFFKLQEELAKESTQVTILDLSEVPYMDSAGMGAIINHYVSAQRKGHKVIASGANYRVVELFKLTKVDSLILLAGSLEEAELL